MGAEIVVLHPNSPFALPQARPQLMGGRLRTVLREFRRWASSLFLCWELPTLEAAPHAPHPVALLMKSCFMLAMFACSVSSRRSRARKHGSRVGAKWRGHTLWGVLIVVRIVFLGVLVEV